MSEPTQPDAGAPAPEPIAPSPEPSSTLLPPPTRQLPRARRQTSLRSKPPTRNRPTRMMPRLQKSPAARLKRRKSLQQSPSSRRGHGPRPSRKPSRPSLESTRKRSWRASGPARQTSSWVCGKPPSSVRPPRPWRSRRNRHKHRQEQAYEQSLPQKALLLDAQYREEFGTPTWAEIKEWQRNDPPK